MYASVLPIGIGFYLLFCPLVTGEGPLFVWLMVFTNVVRIALSLFFVPHSALGAEITDDYAERSSVAGYRVFFSYLGMIVVMFIGFGGFFRASPGYPNGQLNPAAYPPFAATLGALMAIVILWSAWGTQRVIPSLPRAHVEEPLSLKGVLVRLGHDVMSASRSESFRYLFVGVLILFIVIGVGSALNVYMYTYFWELSPNQILLLSPAYLAGTLLGTPLSPGAQRRFGKKAMLLFGTGSWAFWQAFPVSARMLGWLPANGSQWLVPTLVGIAVFQGVCTVQSNVAYVAMLADTVDEQELATGKRQEGVFFAASAFSAKATSGLGAIIAGLGLKIIDWPAGPQIRSAADVPAEKIVQLGILFGPFVAAFGLLCLMCYVKYRLTRERHAEILEALRHRRAATGPHGSPA
jgi:Na+/melibiose symporter-like transporter